MRVWFLGAAIVALLAMHGGVAAQECQMDIREGSAARDLGRVLKCFDERLKAIEAKLNASGSGSSSAIPERNRASFDAGDFEVTVRSAVRDQNRTLRILLNIRNKTTEDVFLGLLNQNGSHVVTDEATGKSETLSHATGLPSISSPQERKDSYAQIPAGTIMSVTLSLNAYGFSGPDITARLVLYQLKTSAQTATKVAVPLSFKMRS